MSHLSAVPAPRCQHFWLNAETHDAYLTAVEDARRVQQTGNLADLTAAIEKINAVNEDVHQCVREVEHDPRLHKDGNGHQWSTVEEDDDE